MLHKTLSADIKDIDEQKGVVSIYINSFNVLDSDGDISAPGSFTKTLKEGLKRTRWFLNHTPSLLLGVPFLDGSKEDDFGLLSVSQFNMKKEIARDTFEDYKLYAEHGRSLEHSFGFDIIKRDTKDERIITEYKLWEQTTLTSWGANEHTPLVDLKGKDVTTIEDAIGLVDVMLKYKYSERKLEALELIISRFKALLNEPQLSTRNEPHDYAGTFRDSLTFIN